jgi:ferrous iron transport protein A
VTLADLKPGETVTIESVATADPTVQRLMVMGLVEGAELTFLRASLGGDPLEFRIFGAAISLRREQAREFTVRPSTSDAQRGDEAPVPMATHGGARVGGRA